MYFFLSAFTSSPTSLATTTKASAFSFTAHMCEIHRNLFFPLMRRMRQCELLDVVNCVLSFVTFFVSSCEWKSKIQAL